MNSDMAEYYAQRAVEYERIYHRSERSDDLKTLAAKLSTTFENCNVLEIACGTGYWTQIIAQSAKSILATDCNRQVIEIAQQKNYKQCNVSFEESDAYLLSNVTESFAGGFCGFWWSHILKSRLSDFLTIFHSKLQDNALVVIVDNNYVAGSSTPIERKDEQGNTYQIRTLRDGSEHEVLKNFPSKIELQEQLSGFAHNVKVTNLTYYWLVEYTATK